MPESVPLSAYLILGMVLFSIGAVGVFVRRNALVVLLSVEIMLNAVNLTFIAFARYQGAGGDTGHVVTFFVIAVAAAEAAVGLALVLAVFRHKKAVNVDGMNALKN